MAGRKAGRRLRPGAGRAALRPWWGRRREAAKRMGGDGEGAIRRRQISGIHGQRGGHAEGAGEEQILRRENTRGAPEGGGDAVFQGGEGRVREGMAGDGEEETG
ncbi:hypothetical protein [Falsiroseomonas sp.]|uniref:hypothetical protein n=1 Tax=Falsiroseomonas sp. TaxID=2870721 RepID=UPI003F72196B